MDRYHTRTTIIGNGLQGMAVAVNLAAQGDTDFKMVGPGRPLSGWKSVTSRQGMTTLRSRAPQFVSDPVDRQWTPKDFAAQRGMRYDDHVAEGDRLSTALMDAFHSNLLDRAGLKDELVDGLCTNLEVGMGGNFESVIQPKRGEPYVLSSEHVVLAPGIGKPRIPTIPGINTQGVLHSHYRDVRDDWRRKHALILGAGQTSWTLAEGILSHGGQVTMTTRSTPTIHRLDFDPAYFNGRLLDEFKIKPLDERIDEVREALSKGRVHPHTYDKVVSHPHFRLKEYIDVPAFKRWGFYVEAEGIGRFDEVLLGTGYKFDVNDLSFASGIFSHVYTHYGFPEVSTHSLEVESVPGLFMVGRGGALGHGPAVGNYGMGDLNAYVVTRAINPDRTLPYVERKTA